MEPLPPALPGTVLRVLATTDLGATFVPVPTSYGPGGTCAGVVELLERERSRQPTVWLDAGDLVVGPLGTLLGRRPWAEIGRLPLSAAAAGNHEFDDGVPALRAAVPQLGYPLLCANADAGLPPAALIDSGAGPLGVIGLTHPFSHHFSQAPAVDPDPAERVAALAGELREQGALAVVALLHDGVDWWPGPEAGCVPVVARTYRLAQVAVSWAADVDLIVGGHVPPGWAGDLGGTPAAHAALFAASVVVADVMAPPGGVALRGVHRAPPARPREAGDAVDALDDAASEGVVDNRHTWISRTGARRYLPDLLAEALRRAGGADAGLVFAAQHATQGALDGAVAALPAGPVTRLDLVRLFGDDDRPVVLRCGPGALDAMVRAHDATTDPRSRDGDHVWWNWARMPAGTARNGAEPRTVAVLPRIVPRLGELLGHAPVAEPGRSGARSALVELLR